MVLSGFDSFKFISMKNYSRRRKLKWLFEFFLFLFFVFHRSSLFSLAGPVIRHLSRRLVVVLNSHIFVFLLFHAMLFVVYTLSHLTDNKSGSNRIDTESGLGTKPSQETAVASGGDSPESLVAPVEDSVDEILVVGEKKTTPAPEPVDFLSPVDDSAAEKLVIGDKSTALSPVNEDLIVENPVKKATAEIRQYRRTGSETAAPSPAPVRHVNSVAKTAEIRQYRRTGSERFEGNREMGKLRRTKTAIQWETGGEAARFLNLVDEMDIDDFNRTVESFIAEQKLHIGGRISS